jgi:hypothetical protein
MSFALRSVAALAVFFAGFGVLVSGCSQQGEGERCSSAQTGNADCDSSLTCVPATQLRNSTTDRCCPAAGTETDSRCARGSAMPSTGLGGAGGEPSAGAPSEGGAPLQSTGGMSSGGAPEVSEGGTPSQPMTEGGSGGAEGGGGGVGGGGAD